MKRLERMRYRTFFVEAEARRLAAHLRNIYGAQRVYFTSDKLDKTYTVGLLS